MRNYCKHDPHPQLTPIAQALQAALLLSIALAASPVHAQDEASTAAAVSSERGENEQQETSATTPSGKSAGSPTMLPSLTVNASSDAEPDGTAASGYRVKSSSIAGFGEQDILDTPFSVKVLSADLMKNQNVTSIAGLDKLDASVSSSSANPGWYSSPMVRGFALSASGGNLTNFRYNGLPFANLSATALENKQQVEILKGLSALQAGFSAPGGLINYVTKRAAAEDVNDLHFSANQHGNAKVHADLSRRSDDGRYGLRVNAAVDNEKTYVDEIDGSRKFASIAFDWELTPDTLLQLDVEHERRNQNNQPFLDVDVNNNLPSGFDPSTFLGQEWARFTTESTLINGKLEHFLDDRWSVALEANWQQLKRDQNMIWAVWSIQPNGDGDVFHYLSPDQTYKPATARASMTGRFETGAVGHELAFGAQSRYLTQSYGPGFFGNIGTTNLHNPRDIAEPATSVGESVTAARTRENGLFVNDVLSFGDAWKLHVGGRYADLTQYGYSTSTGAQASRYEKNAFTPSVALVYKPTQSVSTYISYIEGLEQGGTAPTGTTNAGALMKPLTSEQWEAGVKAEFANGLTAEASLFRIDKGLEFRQSNADGSSTWVQDGLRRHQGLELALTGKLSHEWTLFGSAMLLDAEQKKTGNSATEGKRPTGTPERRVALIAEYSPQALAGWAFSGNWAYTSDRPLNAINSVEAPAYDLFGLGARYDTKFGHTPATLRVNLDNVFDKRYWDTDQLGNLTAGAPRTASASLSVSF